METKGLGSQRATNIIAMCALIVASITFAWLKLQYNLSMDQEHKQLRAYLVNSNMVSNFKPNADGGAFHLVFSMKNYGQTFATDIRVRYDAVAQDPGMGSGNPNTDGINTEPEYSLRRLTQGRKTLAPGQEGGLDMLFTVKKDEVTDVHEMKKVIVLWGRIYYMDVFDYRHSSRFCFFLDTRSVDNKSPYTIDHETGGKCEIDENPDVDLDSYP